MAKEDKERAAFSLSVGRAPKLEMLNLSDPLQGLGKFKSGGGALYHCREKGQPLPSLKLLAGVVLTAAGLTLIELRANFPSPSMTKWLHGGSVVGQWATIDHVVGSGRIYPLGVDVFEPVNAPIS